MNKKTLYFVIPIAAIAVIGLGFLITRSIREPFAGGTRLKLQVVVNDAIEQELLNDAARIGHELHAKGIAFASSTTKDDSIEIIGVDSTRESSIQLLILQFFEQKYEVRQKEKSSYVLSLRPEYARELRQSAVKQNMEVIERRMNALDFGLFRKARVSMVPIGGNEASDQLLVEIPPNDKPKRFINLLTATPQLKLCFVKKENGGPFNSPEAAVSANGNSISDAYDVLPYLDRDAGHLSYMVVSKIPVITGRDLKTARPGVDGSGAPAINFFLTPDGAKRFSYATEKHIGEELAIILDNKVYSAPRIASKIEAEGIITGNFSVQEVEDLALLLRSGAMPASMRIVQQERIRSK
jgi:preprotein translocase subunit SecD